MSVLVLLDAGSLLPRGLQFLQFGWWVVHAVGIALIYVYAYRKGRKDERRRARENDATKE